MIYQNVKSAYHLKGIITGVSLKAWSEIAAVIAEASGGVRGECHGRSGRRSAELNYQLEMSIIERQKVSGKIITWIKRNQWGGCREVTGAANVSVLEGLLLTGDGGERLLITELGCCSGKERESGLGGPARYAISSSQLSLSFAFSPFSLLIPSLSLTLPIAPHSLALSVSLTHTHTHTYSTYADKYIYCYDKNNSHILTSEINDNWYSTAMYLYSLSG